VTRQAKESDEKFDRVLNLRSISEIQLELWHSPDNRYGYGLSTKAFKENARTRKDRTRQNAQPVST
jgi:hypothetical protein